MLKSLLEKFKGKDTAKNSLIALGLKVAGVGLLFLLTIFLTNNFRPELVGQYGFTRSILLILGGISILGAEQSIIYYSGFLRSKDAINNLKSVYFKTGKMILISTLALLALTLLINPGFINRFFEVENPYGLIQKVVLILFFHSVMMLNIETFRALDKIELSEFHRNISRYLLFFIGAFILLKVNLESLLVDVYLWCFALLALITSVQVYFKFGKLGTHNRKVKISTKEIFHTSYPMALNAMTFFLMQTVDVIFLGKFSTFDTVAFYDTAVKVASLTALGTMSVNLVVAPKLSEEFNKGNKEELTKIYRNGIRLMILFGAPAILFLFLFADFTLGMFGTEYKSAKTALYILISAQFITNFIGMSGTYMNMTGKQRLLNKILISGLLLNMVLNYIFIPKWGMNGAAAATGISLILYNLITVLFIYKKDKIKVFKLF